MSPEVADEWGPEAALMRPEEGLLGAINWWYGGGLEKILKKIKEFDGDLKKFLREWNKWEEEDEEAF